MFPQTRDDVHRRLGRLVSGLMAALVLAACTLPGGNGTAPAATASLAPTSEAFLPNPASVYCEAQGYQLEIRTAADGSQSGACVFPDGTECDEWAFYRGECGPSASATALPTVEGGYAGWQAFTHTEAGFAFLYPPDWVVTLDEDPVSTLYEHALFARPADAALPVHLRVVFRTTGDDLLLWPTGTGEGEFVDRDTVPFMGGMLRRVALVCDNRDMAVWYRAAEGGTIQREGLEFSFILAYAGSCAEGGSLPLETQAIGNMIVASFERAVAIAAGARHP